MSDLLKPSILVLNKNWQAIFVKSPQDTFAMLMTDVATALDISPEGITPVKWDDWIKLPIREGDRFIRTSKHTIRIPTVIVLAKFDKVHKKKPKLNSKALWIRDGGVCQYTGRKLAPGEGNIDHVIPRSKGGATSWDNCVIADKRVNSKKADKTPEEAGMVLLRPPTVPKELPVTLLIKNPGIEDWKPFLPHAT